MKLKDLFVEARRRHVFRVAGVYIVGAWLVLQIAELAFPALAIPETAIRYVWIAVILGFPLALVFGWRYDLRDGRIVRTRSTEDSDTLALTRPDYLVLASLGVVALAILIGSVSEISDVSDAPGTRDPADDKSWMEDIDRASVAVLPFVNLSNDPQQGYFSDGLSESLLNLLARVDGLKVAARTSSFHFKGRTGDIAEIARALRVAHLLEGSVRRAGNKVRVTAALVRAEDGFQLWTEEFDREFDDIFVIQDEIAETVVRELRNLLVDSASPPSATSISTDNVAALELYYQANEQLSIGSRASILEAERLFELALGLDDEFNLARVGLLRTYSAMGVGTGLIDWVEFQRRTELVARDMLEHDPDSATALGALAIVDFSRNAPTGSGEAERYFDRSLSIDPDNPDTLRDYAHFLSFNDQPRESLQAVQKALNVDPLALEVLGKAVRHGLLEHAATMRREHPQNPLGWSRAAEVMLGQNRIADAYENLRIAQQKDPDNPNHPALIAMTLASVGLLDEADAALQRAKTKGPGNSLVVAVDAALTLRRGDRETARELSFSALRNRLAPQDYAPHVWLAVAADTALSSGLSGEMIEATDIWVRKTANFNMSDARVEHLLAFVWKLPLIPVYRAAGQHEAANEILMNTRAFFEAASPLTQYAWGFQQYLFGGDVDRALDALEKTLQPDRSPELVSVRANLMDVPFPWTWWLVYEGEIAADLRDNPRYQSILARKDALFAAEREKILAIVRGEGEP